MSRTVREWMGLFAGCGRFRLSRSLALTSWLNQLRKGGVLTWWLNQL